MNKRVCLYARTAINDAVTLNNQLTNLNAYTDENNLTVVFRLSEVGSGKDDNREGIKFMQRLAEKKKIDVVVVKDISRLFRDIALYLRFSETMKRYGVQIVSVEGNNSVDFLYNLCYHTNDSLTQVFG